VSDHFPARACDTHCHVFGPAARFPYDPQRTYTPEDAPREALFALHERLGIDRAVIVQPACHGFDNAVTLDAIAGAPGRYRGIALVPADVDAGMLAKLDAGGMRGVRFNFVPHLSAPPSIEAFRHIAGLIAPLGWHVVLHVSAGDLPGLARYLDGLPVPVVIDHMARIDVAGGVGQDAFATLLDFARDPNVWIKISGGDRASQTGAPYRDVIPSALAIVRAAPDRTLWGTDWPHPNVRGPVPDDAVLVELLHEMLPDAAQLRTVLVDNPERLYGFATRPVVAPILA